MSGINFLLDTNFILGMLKSHPEVLSEISSRNLSAGHCAYSAITRMEMLGYPGIGREEDALIRQKLEALTYLPVTRAIEDVAITLRQTRKVKLPDAIIAATALHSGLELLTLDMHLSELVKSQIAR